MRHIFQADNASEAVYCAGEPDSSAGTRGWRMEDGGWRMEDGGWRMEDGGGRMEDGGGTEVARRGRSHRSARDHHGVGWHEPRGRTRQRSLRRRAQRRRGHVFRLFLPEREA